MLFSEFSTEKSRQLAEFAVYWMHKHYSDSDNYPIELKEGEWDEQFQWFVDHSYEKK